MQIKRLTPDYAVSPRILPEDIAALAAAGFGTIICNRPDAEVTPVIAESAVKDAALSAGLFFVSNPVSHQALDMDMISKQKATLDNAEKPVFAYCASGNRSSIIWALGQAGVMETDDIIAAAASQGYDLSGLRLQIDALAKK